MVLLLNIYPNTSWYCTNFNGNTLDQIKAFTLTNRIIGPIYCDEYILNILYNESKNFIRGKAQNQLNDDIYYTGGSNQKWSKNEINKYGQQIVNTLFRSDHKIFKIRGKISVVKYDFDNNLIDISFEDLYELYKMCQVEKIKSPDNNNKKIKNYFKKVFKSLKTKVKH